MANTVRDGEIFVTRYVGPESKPEGITGAARTRFQIDTAGAMIDLSFDETISLLELLIKQLSNHVKNLRAIYTGE